MAEGLHIELRQAGPIPLDFRLDVLRGETLALVGPSGAGKTTIVRCIAGLYSSRDGKVACNGQAWFDPAKGIRLPARSRHVGLVFQSYALFPHMTAIGNVMEAMRDLPREARRSEAERLLDQVQLADLADRPPSALSGGQQQRVALARALARRPEVLLLDEPFSAVDHPTRRQLHDCLRAVRAGSDIPVLLVTHDIHDAARVADRICLVIAGRNVETGSPGETLQDPRSHTARWMEGDWTPATTDSVP